MKRIFLTVLYLLLSGVFSGFTANLCAQDKDKHLFILSGQSNMARLKPENDFIPAVEKAFGRENVTVVKVAKGGMPIQRWYKKYKNPDKTAIRDKDKSKVGELYQALINKLRKTTGNTKFNTVTFVWMQGEADAVEKRIGVYEESFKGLMNQLRKDLKKEKIYFVIGRITDWHKKKPWLEMRQLQVRLAETSPHGEWVDTDDLNNKKKNGKIRNDLHFTAEGYELLGQRFAEKAIGLIKNTRK